MTRYARMALLIRYIRLLVTSGKCEFVARLLDVFEAEGDVEAEYWAIMLKGK